jgi:hypothetical protein
MEFIEFGKCQEFHGKRLRKQVAEHNGVLTPLTGMERFFLGGGTGGITDGELRRKKVGESKLRLERPSLPCSIGNSAISPK